jgi:hypothetical protein
MPVKKRKSGKGKKKKGASRFAKPAVSFPGEKSEPLTNLLDYSILIYGKKKIGKTSLAARFPDCIFLMTEPGGKALRIYQVDISDKVDDRGKIASYGWQKFVAYVDLLEKDSQGEQKFKTVVIDIVDKLYPMCMDYVCNRRGCNHPSEANDYGDTWKAVREEFAKQMDRLLSLGKGVVFLSHSKEQQVSTYSEREFSQVVTTMPNRAEDYLTGIVDVWIFYGYEGEDRVMYIAGNDYISAGCRLEENFLTPDGDPIAEIPAGNSAQEAYENLLDAFNNELEDATAKKRTRPKKKKSSEGKKKSAKKKKKSTGNAKRKVRKAKK